MFFDSAATNQPLRQEDGQVFEVRMKASEDKLDQLQKIRFEASAEFNDKLSRQLSQKSLYLKINELVMGKVSPLNFND